MATPLPPEADLDPDVQAWLDVVGELDRDELQELYRRTEEEEEEGELELSGPRTEEEIDRWFKDRIGVEIPKVAVCPGHTAPFEIACDIALFRLLRVLIIASRGGAKTSLMAWLDILAAETYPGWEGFTIGPGIRQGERKYEHLLPHVVEGGVIGGKELPHVAQSTQTQTVLKNGSKMSIAPGTVGAANGPRAPRLHRDEVELMERPVYKQAGNIPAGRRCKDGSYTPAQFVDTSTMKWAHGVVAQMKDEYDTAVENGVKPRMEVRIFCIFEVAEERPDCRQAPTDEREARLTELGKDPCSLCDCNEYINDFWDDETSKGVRRQRSLEDVCAGRFFRSRGFKPPDDIQSLFLENPRAEWEAEQECSAPSKEGVYIASYSEVMHGLRAWDPDPENGPIYQGVDWGGDDAHSVGWYQKLTRDVYAQSYKGDSMKLIKAGSIVRFAEIYRSKVGNVAVGEQVIEQEDEWRAKHPGLRVLERYPDSANLAGRLDWRDHCGLETVSRIKKDFKEELKLIRSVVGAMKFYCVIPACPQFNKAIQAWREENGHEVHDWASHPMAEFRYVLHNLNVIDRKTTHASGETSQPAADGDDDAALRLHAARAAGNLDPYETEVIGEGGAEDSPIRTSRGRMVGAPTGVDDFYSRL